MWKILKGIIGECVYNHLELLCSSSSLEEEQKSLRPKQKGDRRGCRGTKDQLMIDKMILKNCRRRLTNLAVCRIDYKKAYDMATFVDQAMYGVVWSCRKCKKTLDKSMKT
jgi:hypothetical protein